MQLRIYWRSDKRLISIRKLRKITKEVLVFLFGKKVEKINLEITVVSNKIIKKINFEFLNKNSQTDVICFNYGKYEGEIIISVDEVIKQCKVYNMAPQKEFLFVLVHGLLHFYGMSDYTEKDKVVMLNRGKKILNKIKI